MLLGEEMVAGVGENGLGGRAQERRVDDGADARPRSGVDERPVVGDAVGALLGGDHQQCVDALERGHPGLVVGVRANGVGKSFEFVGPLGGGAHKQPHVVNPRIDE